MKLDIEEIAAPRSFVFLWCGSGEGLDLGRVVRVSEMGLDQGIVQNCKTALFWAVFKMQLFSIVNVFK